MGCLGDTIRNQANESSLWRSLWISQRCRPWIGTQLQFQPMRQVPLLCRTMYMTVWIQFLFGVMLTQFPSTSGTRVTEDCWDKEKEKLTMHFSFFVFLILLCDCKNCHLTVKAILKRYWKLLGWAERCGVVTTPLNTFPMYSQGLWVVCGLYRALLTETNTSGPER